MKCVSGYYRTNIATSNELCHLRATYTNCDIVNELSDECDSCINSTYILHYNNKICSVPIDNCQIYNTTLETLVCK